MDVFEREPFSVVIRSIQLGKECVTIYLYIYIIYYTHIYIYYIYTHIYIYIYIFIYSVYRIISTIRVNIKKMVAFVKFFTVSLKQFFLDIPDTILIGLRSRPSDVVAELNQLVDVYEDAVSYFNTTNALILGDLNADCSYLSRTRYDNLRLVTDQRFTWLINSTIDTTVSSTDCAYDR